MKFFVPFVAVLLGAQSAPTGTEPSPMEAFAGGNDVRTLWSDEVARFEEGPTRAVVIATILENGSKRIPGVMIDLSAADAKDRVYLDVEATERTRAALIEISDAVARHPMGNGCMGAKEFWPLYDWPWNKFHELNADYCGDALVLSARGKGGFARGVEGNFTFPGKSPTDLAAILVTALDQLKKHE